MKKFLPVLLLFALCGFSATATAELRLATIFQDRMVLQREKPLPIWGWAEPKQSVTVSFGGQQKSAQADENGRWQVNLDALEASTEGRPMTVQAGSESRELKDILVGEVWICAGQSNMARPLRNDSFDYPFFKRYSEDAEYPQIRFVDIPTYASLKPIDDLDPEVQGKATWEILSKGTSIKVMSLGFFFAKDLNKTLGVPVGLVQVAVSGTPLTAWMASGTLDATAAEFPDVSNYSKAFAGAEQKLAKAKLSYTDWAGLEAELTAWRQAPNGRWPGSNAVIPDFPAVLYNALIHPLAPLAIRGVLWHQGESGPGNKHKELFLANLAQWQKLFGQDFYFIWGSLTRKTSSAPPMQPSQQNWSNVNEEFLLASQTFGPGSRGVLVNFFDLGNYGTHWAMKEKAGQRMAGAAYARIFGKPETVFTGPELLEATIDGEKVRAKFRHIGGGLVYEPSMDGISGFVMEGKSGEMVWANVAIEGDTLIFSHPDVKTPANVSYGFHNNPHETLFNKEGFPAFSFRAVPRVSANKGTPGNPLVELVSPSPNVQLSISHVRRDGYLFNVVHHKGPQSAATVRVYLPSEWKEATVTSNGEPVETGPLQTGPDGSRFYEIPAEANGPAIQVSNAANIPDFSAINRF